MLPEQKKECRYMYFSPAHRTPGTSEFRSAAAAVAGRHSSALGDSLPLLRTTAPSARAVSDRIRPYPPPVLAKRTEPFRAERARLMMSSSGGWPSRRSTLDTPVAACRKSARESTYRAERDRHAAWCAPANTTARPTRAARAALATAAHHSALPSFAYVRSLRRCSAARAAPRRPKTSSAASPADPGAISTIGSPLTSVHKTSPTRT
mmetsp:Transcript_978/g.2794  ORF Transcript_978/g.2794 Transcript_978/m.2794 type:complete len:207 (-) Transcript_978:296-916(-)